MQLSCRQGSITQHFAWNYIQLPTHTPPEYLNHRLLNQSTNESSSHTSLTAFDYNAEPLLQQVLFDDPSDIRWKICHYQNSPYTQNSTVIQSTFLRDRTPVKGTPWYSTAGTLRQSHYTYYSIDPLSLHDYNPSHCIIWGKTFQR